MAHKSQATTNGERIIQEGNDEIVLVLKQLVKEQKKTNELLSMLIPKTPDVTEPVVVEEPVKKAKKG